MFKHHLKLAFRNLRKYKTQNIISIIGLAVGFTCFAFSALWIRYEMSYDSFHAKADRIYRVHTDMFKWQTHSTSEIYDTNPYPLANWLKSEFPEIEDACGISPFRHGDKITGLYVDLSFCNIFDVNLPENFFIEGRSDRPAAVTDELKGQIEFIKEEYNFDVQTTIPRWSANTNIPFNMLAPVILYGDDRWGGVNSWSFYGMHHIYILVGDGVNVQVLEEKLDSVMLPRWREPVSVVITPLKQLRFNNPSGNMESDIKFSHIQIFALAGLLVILCSLFNHLTLFVTRVRMRLRELALRKVNGATDWQIAATLYTDFLLVILLSLIAGFMLMALLMPTFKEYATIGNNNISIYSELLSYAVLLMVCSVIAGGIPVLYFRKQALNDNIKGSGTPGSRNMFRKVSLLIQLMISLGMMFCAAVFIKQMRFLHQTDLGINRRNVAAVEAPCCPMNSPHYAAQIKQIPGINDALPIFGNYFLGNMIGGSNPWSYEKDGVRMTYSIFNTFADAHFFDFFGVEIIEGTAQPNEFEAAKGVFNETAMKEVGDALRSAERVVGVSRDFYLTPTTKAIPTCISFPYSGYNSFRSVAYRYEEGMRRQTQQAVTEWMRKEFPQDGEFEINFVYMEDIFEVHFKSERALLTLLSVMTLACILIAVFGVYSLTSLTCQQRRKEIAIRKVHGAEVLDILNIFFKEYLILLAFAALAAFPAAFLIMKRWLEGYVKQTSMDAWVYVAIFLIVFVVIVVSIFSTVWKAANQNPAEVVKSE
ncbi:MAG: FtsX-like permease family protein [Bacteroidales bacterium]|nr:FtsX-like permease family protein [Bacteroidales bacterium]